MPLLRKTETAKRVARSYTGLEKLVKTDPSFPRPIKLGSTRQASVYFDSDELDAWIEAQKAKREVAA